MLKAHIGEGKKPMSNAEYKKKFTKPSYTMADYKMVANRVIAGWCDSRSFPPSEREIIGDLKRSKKRMDEEYSFIKETVGLKNARKLE
jgi:hypothetical protein